MSTTDSVQPSHRARVTLGRTSIFGLKSFLTFVSFVSFVLNSVTLFAQMTGPPAPGYKQQPGITASVMPAPLREIGFDQNLNQQVPLDTELVDESGRAVRLGDYFGSKPIVLAFVY